MLVLIVYTESVGNMFQNNEHECGRGRWRSRDFFRTKMETNNNEMKRICIRLIRGRDAPRRIPTYWREKQSFVYFV